jgi:dTDP-4-amino-4,6-dideoxygalactose transaminase
MVQREKEEKDTEESEVSPTKEQRDPIPIIAPRLSFEELREETERAVLEVLASGDYILGRQAGAFESEAAGYLGVKHAVGVSSGTEALLLALQSLDIGPGDEVVTTCYTFIATATVVARLGARPVFVDIDPETYQMDAGGLARALSPTTRAVMCVHLYGHPAPLDAYAAVCASAGRDVPLIEDAAQAIGSVCRVNSRLVKAGSVGLWGCFSFYPTKNLPACGEAGLMVTASDEHAERARQLRNQGMDAPYRHRYLGGNGRLDGIQAAVLRVRLPHIEDWNERRRRNAALYRRLFEDSGLTSRIEGLRLPPVPGEGEVTNYHQFTIRVPRRDELKQHLAEQGIGAGVYYPIPVSMQPVFAHLGHKPGDFPHAEAAAREVLSLPVHQNLAPGDVERVVAAIDEFYRA